MIQTLAVEGKMTLEVCEEDLTAKLIVQGETYCSILRDALDYLECFGWEESAPEEWMQLEEQPDGGIAWSLWLNRKDGGVADYDAETMGINGFVEAMH